MSFYKTSMYGIVMCLLFIGTPVFAEKLAIVTPYFGTEENTYINNSYGLKLKDSKDTNGLFVQSIDPEKYQWNVFLYNTNDINYSNLSGMNFIYDRYFGADQKVQNVMGIGTNYLKMKLDGKNVQAAPFVLNRFEMDQDIFSLYLRMGRYYKFEQGNLHFIVMPWVGRELDHSQGSGSINFGMGTETFKIHEDQYSWISGINFKLNFEHILQLEAKPAITYLNGEYYWKKSAMMNLFLTRNFGVSYRYDYHETSTGKDSLSIFGIAIMF